MSDVPAVESSGGIGVKPEKLGRHADAEVELKKLQTAFGDVSAYQCATIYAQCGNTAKALEWLVRAVRLPDGGVVYVKTDALWIRCAVTRASRRSSGS